MKILRAVDLSIVTGLCLGLGGVYLSYIGNPANSGICISCFLENIASALRLHDQVRMSYIRPEISGFVLGSFLMALLTGRFRVRGGSSPVIRFLLGFFMIVGCAVFIGCPIKMILRLGAGDLTAVPAVLGIGAGVYAGVRYLLSGFSLDQPRQMPTVNGIFLPFFAVLLFVFLIVHPDFVVLGQKGPAAQHAPVLVALAIGIVIGALAQRSGLCITGGIRNLFLAREFTLLSGVLAALFSAFALSMILGSFHLGVYAQPSSHLAHGWTFLAMFLVGFASVLIDGCPFRQLIKAGAGDVDAAITTLGMLFGAALVYGWTMRSTSAGPTFGGEVAVLSGLIFSILVALTVRKKRISIRAPSIYSENK